MIYMDRELEEYRQIIRKYPTYQVLEYFFNESVDIFNNYNNGIRWDNVPIYNKRFGRKTQECSFNVAQWDLVEACFYSIKYSNDYRSNVVDENTFYRILNETRMISEKLESSSMPKENYLYKHLICIGNMEFDYEIPNIKNKFNRLYHIMLSINNNSKYDQTKKVCYINFKNKFYEITGIDYEKYIKCYMLLVLLSTARKESNLMSLVDSIEFDANRLEFNKDEMKAIIKFQSRDYSFYREYDNWNILKYYPIVQLDKYNNKYIVSNISSLLISFSEFMYWSIRNYYKDINSRDFTSYFGHCFEYYLDDFLGYYKINHTKLDEGTDKKPDWKIETQKYIILVEQKAALYPIDTRVITFENRIDKLNEYLNNNIKNAFVQLNNYDINSSKTIIRICLTFENIYLEELIQDLILPNVSNIKGERYLNWIVPINDFEKLIILLNMSEEKFNNIISKKIELERSSNKDGRGFDKLLSSYRNDYIDNVIDYFGKITDDLKNALK